MLAITLREEIENKGMAPQKNIKILYFVSYLCTQCLALDPCHNLFMHGGAMLNILSTNLI
jgi:hypothetical protein